MAGPAELWPPAALLPRSFQASVPGHVATGRRSTFLRACLLICEQELVRGGSLLHRVVVKTKGPKRGLVHMLNKGKLLFLLFPFGKSTSVLIKKIF